MRIALLAMVITLMGAVSQVVAEHGKATVLIKDGDIQVFADNNDHGRGALINCGNAEAGNVGCSKSAPPTRITWTVLNESGKDVTVEITNFRNASNDNPATPFAANQPGSTDVSDDGSDKPRRSSTAECPGNYLQIRHLSEHRDGHEVDSRPSAL